MKTYLTDGTGFWKIDYCPIGGDFGRAKENLELTGIEKLNRPYKGCTHTAKTVCGKIAYNEQYTITI